MESKKWIWIVVVCLAIVIVYQVVKIANLDPTGPQGPGKEPALQPDQTTTQTASLGGLSSMPEKKAPPKIEPAEVEEPEQPDEPGEPEELDSAPILEEQQIDAEEEAEEQNLPSPETDQKVGWASARQSYQDAEKEGQAPGTDAPSPSQSTNISDGSNSVPGTGPRGLVRGIVYSKNSGSALIDDKIVRAGDTIESVKVVKVHAGGVDFEKNGRRWTQKVGGQPDALWQ